jgi:hypothetical protein
MMSALAAEAGEHSPFAVMIAMVRVSMNWPLGHGEPGDDVDWSEGQQVDVLVVRRRRRWWRLGVLHLVVGCVVVSQWSPVVAASKHYNSDPTIY